MKSNHACQRHHLHWLGAYQLINASCGVFVQSLGAKLEKVQKTQIMPNNANWYSFLEKLFLIFK